MGDKERYIKNLNLTPHQEGGWFAESYRSEQGSAIYFLLDHENFSSWHFLKDTDEVWHYYDGNTPVKIHMITPEGTLETQILGRGSDDESAQLQVLVKKNQWFCAETKLKENDSFAVVGCTCAPAFDYHNFVLGERRELASKYPQHQGIISRLSHNRGDDFSHMDMPGVPTRHADSSSAMQSLKVR